MNNFSNDENIGTHQIDIKNVEEIMANYKPLVSKIARRYFLYGGELDDLMQEGMIGLYKAIKNFDLEKQASFKTFATLCITRQIQSAIRKANSKKNTTEIQMFEYLDSDFDIASNKENPEINLIDSQNYTNFLEKIKEDLSDKEWEILTIYLDGFSYEQIAEKLNITKKSVDNALVRIRSKLSHLVEKKAKMIKI